MKVVTLLTVIALSQRLSRPLSHTDICTTQPMKNFHKLLKSLEMSRLVPRPRGRWYKELMWEVQARIMRRSWLIKFPFLRTIAPSVNTLPLHHLQAAPSVINIDAR